MMVTAVSKTKAGRTATCLRTASALTTVTAVCKTEAVRTGI